jgi:hypothetical protein
MTNKKRLVWSDILINKNLLKRSYIKNIELFIDLNDNIVKFENNNNLLTKPNDLIKSIKADKKINKEFITLDLECYGVKNNDEIDLVPFLVGICNPMLDINKTFNLSNFKLYEIIKDNLLSYKFNGYIIYAQNLSSFDGIYILNQLIRLSEIERIKVEPMFRDRKLIQIKVQYYWDEKKNCYRYSITFRDSLLLFLTSFFKLSKSFLNDKPLFKKDTIKGKFLINELINKPLNEIELKL